MNMTTNNPERETEQGSLSFEEELQLRRLQQEYQGKAHRDVITARLALVLIIVMGATLLIHYVVIGVFAARGNAQAVDALRNVFNSWLPVISGLASAAVTYYFANNK